MFWDASAIVPLLVDEPASNEVRSLVEPAGQARCLWWGTRVECASALARARREGRLSDDEVEEALDRLAGVVDEAVEVQPTEPLRDRAIRLLRLHPLRAADALQLAAALVLTQEQPGQAPFVTLDERLAQAARNEGFLVAP